MLSVFSPRNLQGPLVVCVESSGISMVGHLSDHRGYPRGGGGCTRKISVKICKPETRIPTGEENSFLEDRQSLNPKGSEKDRKNGVSWGRFRKETPLRQIGRANLLHPCCETQSKKKKKNNKNKNKNKTQNKDKNKTNNKKTYERTNKQYIYIYICIYVEDLQT